MSAEERRLLIAVTGASGSIYAERLLQECIGLYSRIYLVVSESGCKVVRHELSGNRDDGALSLRQLSEGSVSADHANIIRVFDNGDLFAPIASGSSAPTEMVVVPCSMGTLARISHGMSSNLIERSADVVLKQKKRLILVPRETPLNAIHLRNMLSMAELGAEIIPAMPAFYQKPTTIAETVDFVVGKIMEQLSLSHDLYRPWNARMR